MQVGSRGLVPLLLLIVVTVAPVQAQGVLPRSNAGCPSATPFGASLPVSVTVSPYAAVTWGKPDMGSIPGLLNLQLSGPLANNDGWGPQGTNWDNVPLTLKSNCNVVLTLTEGLGAWLIAQGLPAQGVWGQNGGVIKRGFAFNWHKCLYMPTVQPRIPGYQSTLEPTGTSFFNPGEPGATLPQGTGVGCSGGQTFGYNQLVGVAPGNGAPTVPYNGTLVIPVGIGISTGAFGDTTAQYIDTKGKVWDWTSLSSSAYGAAMVWAMVSAP